MKHRVWTFTLVLTLCAALLTAGAIAAEESSVVENIIEVLPAGSVAVNEENFPDAIFRELVNENCAGGDYVLSAEEIAAVTRMGDTSYKGISDFKGLEYFTELKHFGCAGNNLTHLDVSANTKLVELFCSYNKLTALDVSKNTELTELSCDSNALTALDVSKNTKLESLDVSDNNLTSINVRNNTALRALSCSRNSLSALDLSACKGLESLACEDNGLTTLNISGCTGINRLLVGGNRITHLDLSGLSGLQDLRCNNGTLAELDISNNPEIWWLECVSFGGDTLDISQNPLLLEVYTGGKTNEWDNEPGVVSLMKEREGSSTLTLRYSEGLEVITERSTEPEIPDDGGEVVIPEGIAVDEEHFPDEAFRIYVSENIDTDKNGYLTEEEIAAVAEINVSNAYHPETGESVHSLVGIGLFTELERLDCRYQGLSELDLTANTKLREAIVYKSGLESIELTGCPKLEVFKCYHTSISDLDFSGNPKLRVIEAGEIDLTSIDVSGCPELEVLRCGGNRIEELNLENNTKLVELSVYNSQIYADGFEGLLELDVSMCPELMYLDLSMNRLKELDVAANTALIYLDCGNTGLEELDIGQSPVLLEVYENGDRTTDFAVEEGKMYITYFLEDSDSVYGARRLVVDEDTVVVTEQEEAAVPGDADGDGKVEPEDLVRVMKSILKMESAEISVEAADLNNDDVVDILDVICLVRKLAGAGA